MAKYFQPHELQDMLNEFKEIVQHRVQIFQKYGVDLLDNDTGSALMVWELITSYDNGYNINLARNGEDAISNGTIIEQKCSNVKPTKKGKISSANFQFHAMGTLEYPRYIFIVRRKDSLDLARIYDIKQKANVDLIQHHLLSQRDTWLEKGKENPVKNMKRDVIYLPEKLLNSNIKLTKTVINNCEIFVD